MRRGGISRIKTLTGLTPIGGGGGGTQLSGEAGLVYSQGLSAHTGVILSLEPYGEEGGDGD